MKVRVPVKIKAVIIDKRDSGYNRKDFKARLQKGKKSFLSQKTIKKPQDPPKKLHLQSLGKKKKKFQK